MVATLTIAHTWDGQAVLPEEQTFIHLRKTGAGLEVTLEAPFHCDPAPPQTPRSLDGLWEFEVVEIFVAEQASRGPVRYTEVELSPHGHYLVIQLEGVRRPVARGLPLAFEARIEGNRWYGFCTIPSELLPAKPWTANAYALHGQAPHRRYLAHNPIPGLEPDFHQPGRFVALPF